MILSDTLLRETRIRFPDFERAQVKISSMEKGGSDRKFYRIEAPPAPNIVLVKYNREHAENQRYVEIAEFLTAQGIRAPKIYFHDPMEGLIWLEDLGAHDLWTHREESWATRRALYESALEEVAKLHRIPAADSAAILKSAPPEFNTALYLWEQHYFFENCLGRYFGVEEKERQRLADLAALRTGADWLASFPRVLVHRDFQSQNIILRDEEAYLIDFQGMRPGLGEYDLASLLYDPYVTLSAGGRAELAAFYAAQAGVSDPDFAEKLRLCAMQRLMQALGAFGYLGMVRGNKSFLEHIPAALQSLGEIVAGIDGLGPLEQGLVQVTSA